MKQRVTSLIPSQGTCLVVGQVPSGGMCEGQLHIDVSLPLSLKNNKIKSFKKLFLSSLKDMLIDFRERGREGANHQSAAFHMCPDRTEPAAQACALTRNQTSDLWVCGMMPNQLSRTSQGDFVYSSLSFQVLDPSCPLFFSKLI